jgi:hypothetical protein
LPSAAADPVVHPADKATSNRQNKLGSGSANTAPWRNSQTKKHRPNDVQAVFFFVTLSISQIRALFLLLSFAGLAATYSPAS